MHSEHADGSAPNTGSGGADGAQTGTGGSSPDPGAGDGSPGSADADFAEALRMIARLPLSDAERAEAVRRLLAGAKR